ncbi:MAG: aminotransferase class V-fold PLP-dependent enzyme [Candidatus Cloacimonetes bacterium]|nr:aminotransferase class V-fold PLP-dependent enzyme [Candidatus Cloacimonadota bacterium]
MKNTIIYLDNAAGSFPKPESVYKTMDRVIRESGGNPGRSGHKLSLSASRLIEETRLLCAKLFHAESNENIIFTNNATTALNIAIKGVINPKDHILTSTLEHNSVSRPLDYINTFQLNNITKIHTDLNHGLNVDDIKKSLLPNTKLLVCTHISNVTGTINDIASIGAFCRDNGIIFLVDAAQSAGNKYINVQEMCIDMLAFPGHKGLLGPQGTGGLYIRKGIELKTILQGGTGNLSEMLAQPDSMPYKFESGTPNTHGLAGLGAGIKFILDTGIDEIEKRETFLINRLIKGLQNICVENTTCSLNFIKPDIGIYRGSLLSINFENNLKKECQQYQFSPTDIAMILDNEYNIAVRSGLHCAADAHRSLNTLEKGGTLRISPNFMNTEEDIDDFCFALKEILSARL